jgi:stage IV sporulation protein A
LVNSKNPKGHAAAELVQHLTEKYGVAVMAVDCVRMEGAELTEIIKTVLYQFPVGRISFELPGFMEGLEPDHWLKREVVTLIAQWAEGINTAADLEMTLGRLSEGDNIDRVSITGIDLGTGEAVMEIRMADGLFYRIIGELMGVEIENDAHFYNLIGEFAEAKKSYDKVRDAMEQVEATEYGIVQPKLDEMILGEPELFQQGSKYGVRLTAKAPSLHIIRTDITTEVSPVVGGQEHAEELLAKLLAQYESEPEKIWETNIFGKTVYEMTAEQMQSKLAGVPDNIRVKIQKSLQKISDEGKEYFICIIV